MPVRADADRRTQVLGRVIANPRLRRAEFAFLAFSFAELGTWIAMLVYAYERGGTTAAALIAVLQLGPAVLVAPIAAGAAERHGGAVALRAGYTAQAVTMGLTAVALLVNAPPVAAYAGAVLAASAVTITRPAHACLMPRLIDSPVELTAANVITSWLESISLLGGPGIAGVLIGIDGPGLVFAVFAAATALAAALVAPLKGGAGQAGAEDAGPAGVRAAVDALRRTPGVGTLVALGGIQFLALGALDVMVVVLAIRVLAIGASAAGYLDAAFGAGGVAGGVGALLLVGRERLVTPLVVAALCWAAAFVAVGIWAAVAAAFALLGLAGAGRAMFDVAGRTMLQRVAPPSLWARLFGVLEGLSMLGLAVGSISVPALAAVAGPRGVMIAIGALLGIAALAASGSLRRVERAAPSVEVELRLLRASPIFAVLSAPVLEGLARSLVRVPVAAGETIVREGELGDRFYLIGTGALEASIGGLAVGHLTAGEGFGEIALLRDGIRTATVTATTEAVLYALERAPFLDAVTGSPHAQSAAEQLLAERLAAR